MLAEQNAALKAELAQAKARIVELEALNADVINRIDWVIELSPDCDRRQALILRRQHPSWRACQ